MNGRFRALVAVFLLAVAAFGGIAAVLLARAGAPRQHPDIEACRNAMRLQVQSAAARRATGEPVGSPSWAAACVGLDDSTRRRLVEEIEIEMAEGGPRGG